MRSQREFTVLAALKVQHIKHQTLSKKVVVTSKGLLFCNQTLSWHEQTILRNDLWTDEELS